MTIRKQISYILSISGPVLMLVGLSINDDFLMIIGVMLMLWGVFLT